MANLLPRGPAWTRDPGSNLMALMGALAPTYERSGAAAAMLVSDIFPATTEALIPEWEETLGLPDPCSASDPSTEQRQAAILAKFIGAGGQSVPYLTSVAAALGYAITITEFTPFMLGVATFGAPLIGPGWESVWQVNAPTVTVSYFHFGESVFGDPFWTVGNSELQCRLQAIAPAHTLLIFKYS
jgi:uncharacterized protein YmfQ (DUF2313 family)